MQAHTLPRTLHLWSPLEWAHAISVKVSEYIYLLIAPNVVIFSSGTIVGQPNATINTVTDNLYVEGVIPKNIFSLALQPSRSLNVSDGEITWGKFREILLIHPFIDASRLGGIDPAKYTGPIQTVYANSD
jgi:hypothetical protein